MTFPDKLEEMKYKDFLDSVASLDDEIGGDKETRTGSHKFPPSLGAWIYDSKGNCLGFGKIVGMEPDRNLGCGCWVGMEVHVQFDESCNVIEVDTDKKV